jgi:hypothetical protein
MRCQLRHRLVAAGAALATSACGDPAGHSGVPPWMNALDSAIAAGDAGGVWSGPDASAVDAGTVGAGGLAGAGMADSGQTDSGVPSWPNSGGADAGLPGAGQPGDAGQSAAAAVNTLPGFTNLAPAFGAALDPQGGTPLTPAPPAGWTWYSIADTACRDGTPAGLYVRFTSSDRLMVYLEGGGACTNAGFCGYNPKSVSEVLSGDGQTALGSIGGAIAGRQQPGNAGIFDTANSKNPFGTWNMVYVPYCTGDVHFGTRRNVSVSGVSEAQQFVGHLNMRSFVARVVPTFRSKVKRVVLTGSSAGGFGAALNFSMWQDAFAEVLVTLLVDSGPAFPDAQLPVCMQKRWRELWGFDAAFPADCTECAQADGGGLINAVKFLQRKHPNFTIAELSSTEDEIIRMFYSNGLDNCANFDSNDPLGALLNNFPAEQYSAGLAGLRAAYQGTGHFASYYINGSDNRTFHQHLWRPRFYEAAQGGVTIADWVSAYLAGELKQIGP